LIKNTKIKNFLILIIVMALLTGVMVPSLQASGSKEYRGFDKGPSYKPVVPIKKTTFVNFDKDSLLDDYAYLSAVPTAIFKENSKVYSHPLLFYEDKYPINEDKERSLNARQGIDYFMEDWMSYSNGQLDQMTLINVDKNRLSPDWKAKDYVTINGDDPYSIANELALQDWSYSGSAVIVPIKEEYEKPNILIGAAAKGVLSKEDVKTETLEVEKPVVGIGATYKSFDINDESYKYVTARLSWRDRVDYDLQLYDDQLGMVQAAAEGYNDKYPYQEFVASYINNHGKWEVSVSAVPKKGSSSPGTMESLLYDDSSVKTTGLLSSFSQNTFDVDISLYPGTDVDLVGSPFGCRDANFKLEWDNSNVQLGLTILDPVGTEIASSISGEQLKNEETNQNDQIETEVQLHIDKLGECRDGENYRICVFSLDDIKYPVDFTIEYNWKQNFSKEEGEVLESASNGAVLASSLNAPLLYVSPSAISKNTKDVLYKLGVEKIYIVDIGNHLSSNVKEEIKKIANTEHITTAKGTYDIIRETSGNNDVIFTTIDPWKYWYATELKPAGTYEGALHIGPAAYIAAHHGSPVIIVDNHPRLSQAITYHTDFWNRYSSNRIMEPSSGSMSLSSKLAYNFLEEYGFGKIEKDADGKPKESEAQDHETIITVAGQFNIGTPWDRSFTGAAYPGRFWGSPVDSAYAICRNVFYPALIFVNPAMEKVKLWQGSSSKTQVIGGRIQKPWGLNLKIYKPTEMEEFKYPVLQTYATYQYRFNSEGYKHWDFKYTRADGITPYETPSKDRIDDGAAITKAGQYYPDQSDTEVIPFYCKKAGYDSVFSANFDYITENLNEGVLLWVIDAHGYYSNGGMLGLWNPDSPYVHEENPWRAYEPIMFKPGHLRTYLHFLPYYYHMLFELVGQDETMLKTLSSIKLIKFQLFPEIGSTDNPDVALINPQLIYLNKAWTPIKDLTFMHDLWGMTGVMIYRDRLLHPLKAASDGLPLINWYNGDGKVTISPSSGYDLTMRWRIAYDFDDALKNLHSAGINTISCLPANTYLHLTWMRHGATYQIIDPWTTTDWSATWQQMLIKSFAMGDTIGEAYEKGMRACGPEFPIDHWWWDLWENVELFGDPDLRVYVPNTEFSDKNHWAREDTKPLLCSAEPNIDGHTPFGAKNYPNEKEPKLWVDDNLFIITILGLIIILLIIMFVIIKKK